MEWTVVAEGTNFDDVKTYVQKLPHGTKFNIELQTDWWAPIAPLADLAGAEWVANMLYSDASAILDDVEGVGLYKIIMHCTANAVQLAVLLPILAAIVATAGIIAAIIAIVIFALIELVAKVVPWVAIGLIAIGGFGTIYLLSRRKTISA